MPDKDAKPPVMEVFPIVAPSPDHVWAEISLTMLVTSTIHYSALRRITQMRLGKISEKDDKTKLSSSSRDNDNDSQSQEPAPHDEPKPSPAARNFFESHNRDAEDMDLGFGSSRFDDAEDGEDARVKFSLWGDDGDEEGGQGKGGGVKRKRASRKSNGDAYSTVGVLKVIEM